jgi:hypothetical protein
VRRLSTGPWLPRVGLAACAALAAATLVASGAAARAQALTAPTALHALQLHLGDGGGATPSFTRSPAFAWDPVRGATHYEFQLASSKNFAAGDGLLWASRTFRSPVAAIPISLPWLTNRASDVLYWRVRALANEQTSPWSPAQAFHMKAAAAPTRVASSAGYVSWTTVPGARGYLVWFENLKKQIAVTTTSADLRDYYGASAPATAVWRVRALKRVVGSDKRALPVVSYGPWSGEYRTAVKPNVRPGLATLSSGTTARRQSPTHALMPVFLFPVTSRTQLDHVYVTSDAACTHVVFNSAIVRGGAFAPRSLQYAPNSHDTTPANDGAVFMQDGKRVVASETGAPTGTGSDVGPARVALPSGRYYWTVVRVTREPDGSYHDQQLPKNACKTSRASFTKTIGRPGLGNPTAPFAVGLSADGGHLVSAKPKGRFYGTPLVAWSPVPGAARYEVEWSHYKTKWQKAGSLQTAATSATLPLSPGTWWYHVRALDTGAAAPAWSAPATIQIATPTFSVVG